MITFVNSNGGVVEIDPQQAFDFIYELAREQAGEPDDRLLSGGGDRRWHDAKALTEHLDSFHDLVVNHGEALCDPERFTLPAAADEIPPPSDHKVTAAAHAVVQGALELLSTMGSREDPEADLAAVEFVDAFFIVNREKIERGLHVIDVSDEPESPSPSV